MNELPKSIADLCGVMLDAVAAARPQERQKYDNPIQWKQEGDGTLTLTMFDQVVGWANPTKLDRRDGNAFRAVSVHGDVRLCWSERMARDWLLEVYH
jgi:hypothetical protein